MFYILDIFLKIIPVKKRKTPSEFKKILVVQPAHLGDMLMTTSIIESLRQQYPFSEIDIVCGSWALPLVKKVNKIYVIDHYILNRSKKHFLFKYKKFVKDLSLNLVKIRKENYDVCILLRAAKGNFIITSRLLNFKYIVGYGTRGFGKLLDYNGIWIKDKHEIEHFYDLLNQSGIVKESACLNYSYLPANESKNKVEEVLKTLEYCQEKKYAILHPGSGDQNRMLPWSDWLNIVKILKEYNYSIYLTGISADKIPDELNRQIDFSFVDKLKIDDLIEMYRKVDIIFTVESLAGHLASLTNTKTVSIYTYNPIQWKPTGNNVIVLNRHTDYVSEIENIVRSHE